MSTKVGTLKDRNGNIFLPQTDASLISGLSNVASSGSYSDLTNKPDLSVFISNTVNNLANYYLKSETYTRSEIENLIGAIQQFHYETAVSTSSVSNPVNNVLYLIGPTGTGSDRYEEYVYDPSKQDPWIKIGDTSIDLSNYVTLTSLNTILSGYTNTSDLTTLLNGKYSKPSAGIPASDLSQDVQDALVSKFFVAEIGVTTYDEVVAARSAGKIVICYGDNDELFIANNGEDPIIFTSPSGLGAYCIYLESDDSWSNITYLSAESQSNKVSSWSASLTDYHYPSEKLVKDSLDTKYEKPTTGIPFNDLANDIKIGINKLYNVTLNGIVDADPINIADDLDSEFNVLIVGELASTIYEDLFDFGEGASAPLRITEYEYHEGYYMFSGFISTAAGTANIFTISINDDNDDVSYETFNLVRLSDLPQALSSSEINTIWDNVME